MDKSSSQLKLSNSDLRLKLKAKDKEIFKNLQKVSEVYTCVLVFTANLV